MKTNALRGGSLVFSAPTSAGKTLIADFLMFKQVLTQNKKKAMVILPYVSVTREKTETLKATLRATPCRVEAFHGGHHPVGGFKCADIGICTIEKANSIINK